MASEDSLRQLQELSNAIKSVNRERLLRPTLGEESLQQEFAPRSEKIQQGIEFALEHAQDVHDTHVQDILSPLSNIQGIMEQQANWPNAEYVTHRSDFLTNIDAYLEELKQFWPPFVTAAVQARGFLEDEGVRREYERTMESMKKESDTALQQVRSEAEKTIEEARTLAEQIENRARRTAARISVEDAQQQFRDAQPALDRRVKIWSALGILSVGCFVGIAIYYAAVDLPDHWRWQVIYHSAIRVTILTATATAGAFCLKILRAHMHMSEKNRHRQRVANSIGSFVESAATPEQRDLILSQLVDSVTQFGNSGLVQREEDSAARPRVTIDSIMRTLSSSPKE